MSRKKKILIIGLSGTLAQTVALKLLENDSSLEILGVDARPLKKMVHHPRLSFKKIRYTRSEFEKLFRSEKFYGLLHLGRMGHGARSNTRISERRLQFNLVRTKEVLDLSYHFKLKKILLLSTFHVYGALPDNPVFLDEESPLRSSLFHSELRDVVEMDQMATAWMYRYQNELSMVILRPCHIIGPGLSNTMSMFLKNTRLPIPIDYNPALQFIHVDDMAKIVVDSFMNISLGVFNISSEDFINLREAKKIVTGRNPITFPYFTLGLLRPILSIARPDIPSYLIDYLRYPCLLDHQKIKSQLKYSIVSRSVRETLESLQPGTPS